MDDPYQPPGTEPPAIIREPEPAGAWILRWSFIHLLITPGLYCLLMVLFPGVFFTNRISQNPPSNHPPGEYSVCILLVAGAVHGFWAEKRGGWRLTAAFTCLFLQLLVCSFVYFGTCILMPVLR